MFSEFLQYQWAYETDENDITVRIWDVKTGNVIQRLNGHKNDVGNVNLSSDSKILISSGADGKVVIWDTTSLLKR
jgi:glucose repression regulatory protein TUP1